jgi:GTPase SAR1 family protein
VKILFVGLAGSGKTQLIRTLLSSEYAAAGSSSSSGKSQSQGLTAGVDAFAGATRRVEVARGMVLGCEFTLIDTPGLQASAAGFAANLAALNQVRKAFLKHRPDLVIYVDR